MIERTILPQIQKALSYFPAVGIIGPRQVGKTTLAKILEKTIEKPVLFLDLERDTDRQKLKEAEYFLQLYTEKCVIIDEIQNMPSLFPLLRWLIDQDRQPARYILTGSASPDIIKGSTETLAGRIAYFELMPFSLLEILDIKSYHEHWFRGGFPDALLAPSDEISEMWLSNFIETFLHRDIRQIGYEITVPAMERFLKVLASMSGNLLNIDDLSRTLGLSSVTIKKYLDILEGTFLMRRLTPYYVNTTKRLVRSPKIYIRDSGLMHRLLGLKNFEQLFGSIWLGNSWESYVIEEIIRTAGKSFEYFFYRTHAGAEVDLILKGASNRLTFIEIKFSSNPTPSKGFFNAAEELIPAHQYVIVPEGETWQRGPNLKVSGL
ncbi:MAG: ATP-binding protein, partial [Runella sp.]